MKRILYILISVFCISSCSIPETKIYSLYIPIEQKQAEIKSNKQISIHIESPKYLSQPYIAYRKNLYQLEISRYSKWESSPVELVSNTVRESLSAERMFKDVTISNAFQNGMYNLTIDLKQFERYDEENETYGMIAMNIVLFDPSGKELFRDTISERISLNEKSFLSLAKHFSKTLSEGIDKIQTRIRKELRNNL
jgi:uncharacterized lipoprotein YmbA